MKPSWQELQEMKGRVSAATPGPWSHDNGIANRDTRPAIICCFESTGDDGEGEWWIHGDIASIPDAQFIAAARTDMPRLIEAHEHLQSELQSVVGELAAIRDMTLNALEGMDVFEEWLGMTVAYPNEVKNLVKFVLNRHTKRISHLEQIISKAGFCSVCGDELDDELKTGGMLTGASICYSCIAETEDKK